MTFSIPIATDDENNDNKCEIPDKGRGQNKITSVAFKVYDYMQLTRHFALNCPVPAVCQPCAYSVPALCLLCASSVPCGEHGCAAQELAEERQQDDDSAESGLTQFTHRHPAHLLKASIIHGSSNHKMNKT